jgi:hypothetical protein
MTPEEEIAFLRERLREQDHKALGVIDALQKRVADLEARLAAKEKEEEGEP